MKSEWREGSYGFHYLDIPGGFTFSVHWESGGYKVSFGTMNSLKARFESVNEAKEVAVAWAKQIFKRALESL